MEYRRAKVAGGTYFFTVVTEKRQKNIMFTKKCFFIKKCF